MWKGALRYHFTFKRFLTFQRLNLKFSKKFWNLRARSIGSWALCPGPRVPDPESRVLGPYLDYACYQLFNFPCFRSSPGGVLQRKVFLEISQENACCKVSFLIKLQAVSTAWSFSGLLLLKISCLFHFNRKMKWGKYPDGLEILIYFFARVSICLRSKISKKFDRW